MSHFYGTLQGSRGEATRCGTTQSGLTALAAGWGGAVEVVVWHSPATGLDLFEVRMVPWQGAGDRRVLAEGVIGRAASVKVFPNDTD